MMRFISSLFMIMGVLVLEGCNSQKLSQNLEEGTIEKVDFNPVYDFSSIDKVLVLPIDNPQRNQAINANYHRLLVAILENFENFTALQVLYDRDYNQQLGKLVDLQTGEVDQVRLGDKGRQDRAQAWLQICISEYRLEDPWRMEVRAVLTDSYSGETIWLAEKAFDANDHMFKDCWRQQMKKNHRFDTFSLMRFNRPNEDFFIDYVFYNLAKSYEDTRRQAIQAHKELKEQADKQVFKLETLQKIQTS
ncbi:MAG: hypothetical protein ACQEP8_03185 [Chlamydiota bacterium]